MGKSIHIALAGNPNCGKTTLFNALTGMNQFVGNWPGVTVEKKEGKLKRHDDVIVTDLPGIYSLSPYTLEEVVARNYLLDEAPEVILNIVDGTNLERNLYLTTQLMELGIPMVVAINMMDVVRKNGDRINIEELSRELGCRVVEISALKEEGIQEAAEAAIEAASQGRKLPMHNFSGPVEHAIAHIEEAALHSRPSEQQRWYAVKIFERDSDVIRRLKLPDELLKHIEEDIVAAEKELDNDAESIISGERYVFIADILKGGFVKKNPGELTLSDKIDRVVTNRWLALPILVVAMFLVYYISMVTIGQAATDWANDGLFGDGFHLFGVGTASYEQDFEAYEISSRAVKAFAQKKGDSALLEALDAESKEFSPENARKALAAFAATVPEDTVARITVENEEDLSKEELVFTGRNLAEALPVLERFSYAEPEASQYGWWIPGIPVLVTRFLERMNCADWLRELVLNGVIAGVGAVLGFVPQMLVLFLLLACLEACGYMARIAFVLDRIFRRIGLSGKSFIPILIGTGCGVPGIMASRTIENERDRRMTIITTTFIPCSAKTPFIAMVAGVLFGGSAWIATSAYFIGMASIVISGIILKKTARLTGKPAPFLMELPAYHMPKPSNVLYTMWERSWSFIKRAGTIILLCTILVWFLSNFGFVEHSFRLLEESQLDHSILAVAGNAVAWIFSPLGWGNWQATVASVTGLIAKENIVGTMSTLYQDGAASSASANISAAFSKPAGFSFLVFNLLCAPCAAAIGAIAREMNSARWTAFAIGYQTLFAYMVALMAYNFGCAIMGKPHPIGLTLSIVIAAGVAYMLFKPNRELTTK